MGVTRRNFLQGTGLALAGWGVSNAGLWTLRDRYLAALAIPTPRKLALLVGINQYTGGTKLEGCVTDVELQRELLIHRFGFRPADVLTLTDKAATRSAVESAFLEHLVNQAQPGDVVVFHFSGLGSTIPGKTPETTQNSLVMVDTLPPVDVPIVNDLLEETLWLLVRSLKTDKVTTILDTSYAYPGSPLQGNLRVRSFPNPSTAQPSQAELAFQEQLLTNLSMDREQLQAQRRSGMMRGLVLAAAKEDEIAAEGEWSRWSAGLFTAALTQVLWQATTAMTVRHSLRLAAEQMSQFASQQHPQLKGQKSQEPSLLPYFAPIATPAADGVVVAVEDNGKTAQLWLGGLSASLLEGAIENTVFALLPGDSASARDTKRSPVMVQVVSQEGLVARAKVCCLEAATSDNGPTLRASALVPGQFVQEMIRVVPRNTGLTVALDACLERIERVDAISALSAIPRISSAIAGAQAADYLFSKVQSRPPQLASLPSDSAPLTPASTTTYGLFSPGRDILLGTTSETGEAIKGAVRRLVPKLRTLLATKLLSLTVNEQTSRLGLRARLELLTPQERVLVEQQTDRTTAVLPTSQTTPVPQSGQIFQIPLGSRLRYRIENFGSEPIYLLAVGLASSHHLIRFAQVELAFPGEIEASAPAIAPGETVLLPPILAGSEWKVQKTTGLTETFLICSTAPFTQTLALLANPPHSEAAPPDGSTLVAPLETAQAILQDLTQTSNVSKTIVATDDYALDVNTWATFQFVYQIV